jgi:hypothetical protein
VNIKRIGIVAISGVMSALGFTACGGGGSSGSSALQENCALGITTACELARPATTATSTTAAATLYTTAPSAITITSGSSPTYSIGNGRSPYTVTSSNTSVVTTNLNGSTLTINGITGGTAQVMVADAMGKSVPVNVTVLSKGQTGIPPSLFPPTLTVGDCTTNIPFVFTGGTPPFTILTTDAGRVPVSSAMPLGSENFFLASLGPLGFPPAPGREIAIPVVETLTVLDSQSRAATVTITVPFVHDSCPINPLLEAMPSTANAHVSEILGIQFRGGGRSYTFKSNAPNIANIVASDEKTFVNIQGLSSGTALITIISSDGQQANIPFTVLP